MSYGHVVHVLGRLGLCLGPLIATPVLALLIGEGYLNFGGGEKDLILLLPWIVWSLVFGLIFALCWRRKLPIRSMLPYAAGGATLVVALAWAGLLIWTLL